MAARLSTLGCQFRYIIGRFQLWLHAPASVEPVQKISWREAQDQSQRIYREINLLRGLLPRCPTWRAGHARLLKAAFGVGDHQLAYSSAVAVERLGGESRAEQAECLLAWGEAEEAERILSSLPAAAQTPAVLENLAAALAAREKKAEALATLQKIPADQRNAVVTVMIERLSGVNAPVIERRESLV